MVIKGSPEKKFPAENEDIDTIITGTDGKDYVVDVVEGLKKWVPYLPESDDEIIIEKTLPRVEGPSPVKKKEKNPAKEHSKYAEYLKEMTAKFKMEKPDLVPKERISLIQEMWKTAKKNYK